MTNSSKLRIFAAGMLVMSLAACTGDQITTSLELAVDAAIAASPAVETAANVPPGTQQLVGDYLAATETCLSSAAGVVSARGVTPAAAAAQITGACSAELLKSPALPPGTPTNVTAAVSAVAAALGTFLNAVPKTTAIVFTHPEFVSGFAGHKPVHMKIDKKRLDKIHEKLAALRAKLHK